MTNPDVGTLYHVALNDVGYILRPGPDNHRYRRLIVPVEPERFATGATPLSESFERYSFLNSSNWRGGAGQRFLNRGDSDESSFWESLNLDPFCTCHRLHLTPAVKSQAVANNPNRFVAGRTRIIVRSATNEVKAYTLSGDTPTLEFTYTTSSNAEDLDMAAGFCWVATVTALDRIDLGTATISTGWSLLDVIRVEFIGDRLAIVYRDAGTNTWRLSTLDFSATEEKPGGVFTLPGATAANPANADFQIGGMTSGNGYVWFTGWSTDEDSGYVYVWPVDLTASGSVAWRTPAGETPNDVFFYQGNVFVRTIRTSDDQAVIYRCAVNGDGTLTPFLLVDDAGTGGGSPVWDGVKFAARGNLVFFSWNAMSTTGGIGVINLATGGYAKRSLGAAGVIVRAVGVWGNRPAWSNSGQAVYFESEDEFATSGWLRTSIADADSAIAKVWDRYKITATALGASEAIDTAYTVDEGTTYVDLDDADLAPGDEEGEAEVDITNPNLGLQFTFTGPGSSTPYMKVASLKFHPGAIYDEILTLPIDCSEETKVAQGATYYQMGVARNLEALRGTLVTVQDVDWPETKTSTVYELISVDTLGLSIYDRSKGINDLGLVALCTFRRELA